MGLKGFNQQNVIKFTLNLSLLLMIFFLFLHANNLHGMVNTVKII